MKDIILSLIIPVYNTEQYIDRCLDSAVCQRHEGMEIIIVNDCSTDGSLNIINKYIDIYDNIFLINLPENKSVGYARNAGLQNAKGKYIGFIDSDDWMDINAYDLMVMQLDNYDADIAVCGVKNEYPNSKNNEYRYRYAGKKILSNNCALNILTKNIDMGVSISSIVCNKLFKRNLLTKYSINFPVNSYNEDDYFTFLSFIYAQKIIIVPDCYYHYYQRTNSITHTFSKKHIDDLFSTFNLLKQRLIEQQMYSAFENEYYSFLNKCLVFILSIMFKTEQNDIIQKRYIQYTLEVFLKYFTLSDLVTHLDTMQIKRYLNLL